MDNIEKLTIYGTQEKQNKNTMQYVLDPLVRKETQNNVNKRQTLLQTTGGKYKPNIVFYAKIVRYYQLRHNILEVSIQV